MRQAKGYTPAPSAVATAGAAPGQRQRGDGATTEVSGIYGPMHPRCFWVGLPEGNGRVSSKSQL